MKSRIATVCGLAGSAVLLLAGPAFAHVSVQPKQAEQGGYTKLVFQVPNERDNASTVKVEVNLPTDHPIASVQTTPVPGWNVQVVKSKLAKPLETDDGQVSEAITKVTWSGGKIAPGTFLEFPISVGPLPENTDKLVFKALQTYDNKEVVRWIEEPTAGGSEPENPAPVLTLTKPANGAESHGHGRRGADKVARSDEHDDHKAGRTPDEDAGDDTARALGAAGIAVGILGTVVGFLGLRRGSRTPPV